MKKIFLIISVLTLTAGMTMAQELGAPTATGNKYESYYGFSWNTLFTLGDFNDWVGQAGPAGAYFEGHYLYKKAIDFGAGFGWSRVSENYSNATYQAPSKGLAITATNYRFTWMVPMQAFVGYHFMTDKLISPYLNLGIGTDYMEHHLVIQEYDIYKTRWDFSLMPEVGATFRFGKYTNWGALVAFNYKWTTNQIELRNQTSSNLSMMNLKIGFAYMIY